MCSLVIVCCLLCAVGSFYFCLVGAACWLLYDGWLSVVCCLLIAVFIHIYVVAVVVVVCCSLFIVRCVLAVLLFVLVVYC